MGYSTVYDLATEEWAPEEAAEIAEARADII